MKLLSPPDSNPKVAKNTKLGYATAVLHLAPASMSGFQVCSKRSPGCEAACLHYAGSPVFHAVKNASRIRKTKMFFGQRKEFMEQLVKDVKSHITSVTKKGLTPAFRLNGTSDIPWERVKLDNGNSIITEFPGVQFYDYTAIPNRVVPSNYHLTFSLKENNEPAARQALDQGTNVAAVFFGDLPTNFWGLTVLNGDEHDYRPIDPPNSIVGLKVKGPKGRQDETGFVKSS